LFSSDELAAVTKKIEEETITDLKTKVKELEDSEESLITELDNAKETADTEIKQLQEKVGELEVNLHNCQGAIPPESKVTHFPYYTGANEQCAYCHDNNRRPYKCGRCDKTLCIKGKVKVKLGASGNPLVHTNADKKPVMCYGPFGMEPKRVTMEFTLSDDSVPTQDNPNCWLAYHAELHAREALMKTKEQELLASKKEKSKKKRELDHTSNVMDLVTDDDAATYCLPAVKLSKSE
jgi:hypothetical protein